MEPLVNKFPSFQMVLIISFGDMDLFLATIFSIISSSACQWNTIEETLRY